jgi:Protein ChrB, N-terminal
VGRSWLLITTSTAGGSSTLRVWTWRRLRGLGAHYLQQSVCLLPATPETRRGVNRVLSRLHDEGGGGQVLEIGFTDEGQEAGIVAAFQRERSEEYGEVVERTKAFHAELALRRGRATYAELEESDADLARHERRLKSIQTRDYFGAPGADAAIEAVDTCRHALAEFEAEALHGRSVQGPVLELDGR